MERARAIKQQGNDFFKQQKYEDAIKCYQEAIKVCPPEKIEDIAIFHQNIGAVYDQMVGVRERERESKSEEYFHMCSVICLPCISRLQEQQIKIRRYNTCTCTCSHVVCTFFSIELLSVMPCLVWCR